MKTVRDLIEQLEGLHPDMRLYVHEVSAGTSYPASDIYYSFVDGDGYEIPGEDWQEYADSGNYMTDIVVISG